MFSVSMMASSTTSPSAMASPPMTSTLRFTPLSTSTTTAASSDSGMASAEISAVRQSYKPISSTSSTSVPPTSRCRAISPIAVVM